MRHLPRAEVTDESVAKFMGATVDEALWLLVSPKGDMWAFETMPQLQLFVSTLKDENGKHQNHQH